MDTWWLAKLFDSFPQSSHPSDVLQICVLAKLHITILNLLELQIVLNPQILICQYKTCSEDAKWEVRFPYLVNYALKKIERKQVVYFRTPQSI